MMSTERNDAESGSEQILPIGVPVYTRDGTHIGSVKEESNGAFKVNAPMRPDYWLSTESIESTDGGRYTLNIDENRLKDYRVRDPQDDDPENPGGMMGKAGVYPQSTAAAGLLIPEENRPPGSDPGDLSP
jgi:hypothetical protein